MTRSKQESNNILLQKRNRTRIWQGNIPKICGEKIKGNGEVYFYLYPLGP
jgi:hypothetical protein